MILEYDRIQLILHGDGLSEMINSPFYKLRLKRYVASGGETELLFKRELIYLDFKKIIELLQKEFELKGYVLRIDRTVADYLEAKEFHIQSKYRIGNDVKNRDERLLKNFDEFKAVVDRWMVRKLRDKQMWDSFFMCIMSKSANFSVPGSGKTASVLGMYAYLKDKNLVNKIIMIGPKNAFGSWVDEFKACFGSKEELCCFNIHSYPGTSRIERINKLRYDTGNVNLMLFNYESLGSYEEVLSELIDDKCLLVFDEVHKVKSITGDYASHALEVAKSASYEVTMTGTPIPNSYTDIYNMLHILYNDEYNDFFGFSTQLLKNPNAHEMQLINDRLQPFFCRTTKKELDVPSANDDRIYRNAVSPEENKLFWILYKKYKGNKFSMLVRMLQMESNPKLLLKSMDISEFRYILDDSVENERDIDFADYSKEIVNLIGNIQMTTKMRKCIELTKELYEEGKVVIIWCIFVDSMEHLKAELDRYGIRAMCINGRVELEERGNILSAFKSRQFDVLITNPHTLAESVSLHSVCHDAIYFEYSYNLVHLLQSKDRIHRLGLSRGQYTQYCFMMDKFDLDGEDYSLDEQIYSRLKEKEDIMLKAIDNNVLESVTSTEEDLNLIFEKLKKIVE